MKEQEKKLGAPLSTLSGVGPAIEKKLQNLNLYRVEDLLFLLPLRYEDRTCITKLKDLNPGIRSLVTGEVLDAKIAFRGRRNLIVKISDGTGTLTLRFFYFSRKQYKQFEPGTNVTCYGEIRRNKNTLEIIHPEYRILQPNQRPSVSKRLTPIYPTTMGIQQGRLRNLVNQAITIMRNTSPDDLLPKKALLKLQLPSLEEALLFLHQPPAKTNLIEIEQGTNKCQLRLSFEELLAHYMSLRKIRLQSNHDISDALINGKIRIKDFIKSLPFKLTNAQKKVSQEILEDLSKPHPMMRMIQGDVGSGKTIVAAIACLKAISCGKQVAIMAPTELLAEQHWENFSRWYKNYDVQQAWLSGNQGQRNRNEALQNIASGKAKLIIGTHALFQEKVNFFNLALIVIDEQHRFGVAQRMALRDKGVKTSAYPHQLVMTATPIPRTLAMAAYADLDTSIIDELPPGRKQIKTIVLPNTRRNEVIERVRIMCSKGQQAYWVCPLIEESENFDFQSAESIFSILKSSLQELQIGLIHGRMLSSIKEKTMHSFKNGDIHLLVATTVIEVGVDVPQANLMIIENSERMGLSQLHQLRGRVGRGGSQSHCVLLYRSPLGNIAHSRLEVLRQSSDGFLIAQRDLELRGPGELLGTRQTGLLPQYRIADLIRDAKIMPEVQNIGQQMLENNPEKAELITHRWLGDSDRYVKV